MISRGCVDLASLYTTFIHTEARTEHISTWTAALHLQSTAIHPAQYVPSMLHVYIVFSHAKLQRLFSFFFIHPLGIT